jgi:cell division protein FtsN
MKHLSLIATLFIALILFSCGAKDEKTEELSSDDNGIVDETLDTNTSYEEFVADGFSEDLNPVDTSKSEKMVYIDPSKEIQIDPPIEKKEEVVPVKELPKETVKTHETRFYVVAGSFKKYSNAQNLFNYFKKKGYSPLILPKVNGYNRVAIISYTSENQARASVKKLRTEHNDLTFWLYKW